MDVLKNQLARIQQQLSGLSASQKMLTASLVAIMLMTLLWLGRYAAAPEMLPVVEQSLQAQEIALITGKLTAAGIDHRVVNARVLVPADRRDQAEALLAYEGVRLQGASSLADITQHISPFANESTNQRIWNASLQQDVERIISNMPGVASASVLIDPTHKRRVEGSVEPSAGVAVWLRHGYKPTTKLVQAISAMVTGPVAAMNRNRVSITIFAEGVPYTYDSADTSPISSTGEHVEAELGASRIYEQQIRNSLAFINSAELLVTVRAKIDTESSQIQENRFDKIDQKERSSETETFESTAPIPSGGEPGTASNTGLALGDVVVPQESVTSKERNRTDFENFASETRTTRIRPAGDPTPVSASVWLPRSYYVETYKHDYPSASADDAALDSYIEQKLSAVRRSVMNTLSLTDSAVFVETYARPAPTLIAAGVEPPQAGLSSSLTTHAKEIAIGSLALISLVMVSMMVRKPAPSTVIATGFDAQESHQLSPGESLVGEAVEGNGTLDGMELDEDTLRAQQMVDQVSTMVRENPDAAANLVKRWLNRS